MIQDIAQAPKVERYEVEIEAIKRKYWAIVEYDEKVERFVAKCPAWPDLGGVAGETSQAAVDNMQAVLTRHIETGAFRQ